MRATHPDIRRHRCKHAINLPMRRNSMTPTTKTSLKSGKHQNYIINTREMEANYRTLLHFPNLATAAPGRPSSISQALPIGPHVRLPPDVNIPGVPAAIISSPSRPHAHAESLPRYSRPNRSRGRHDMLCWKNKSKVILPHAFVVVRLQPGIVCR